MKKALKIGLTVMAFHCAVNEAFLIGMATPIVNELIRRNYHNANELSKLNHKNYKNCKLINVADTIDDAAKNIANIVLTINKQEWRVDKERY